ncbi:hypothetical protein VNI00_013475 [Paramarasmius palmivorus]|uniref:Uncharacterized protein n=1 Tax=Paramarasmius palmivorus TaxID=297713 RepID=A0AAW0BZP0_9AGAR
MSNTNASQFFNDVEELVRLFDQGNVRIATLIEDNHRHVAAIAELRRSLNGMAEKDAQLERALQTNLVMQRERDRAVETVCSLQSRVKSLEESNATLLERCEEYHMEAAKEQEERARIGRDIRAVINRGNSSLSKHATEEQPEDEPLAKVPLYIPTCVRSTLLMTC